MMLASGEVVKTPPKSACYAVGTVHCPSADTDLCIAINSLYSYSTVMTGWRPAVTCVVDLSVRMKDFDVSQADHQ